MLTLKGVFVDGIHGTPYIAAPWVLYNIRASNTAGRLQVAPRKTPRAIRAVRNHELMHLARCDAIEIKDIVPLQETKIYGILNYTCNICNICNIWYKM